MAGNRSLAELSSDVAEELRVIAARVTQGLPAFRALRNVLDDGEWRQIENELQDYYPSTASIEAGQKQKGPPHEYAIQKLVMLRKVSPLRAVIDLARANDLLTDVAYRRLLREIGEQEEVPSAAPVPAVTVTAPEPPPLPEWDGELCELRFGGRVVKRVRGRKVAANVVRVLDSFQELKWPRFLRDPLPGGVDPKRHHDTISSLNEGLAAIHFRSDGTGTGYRWDPIPPSPSAPSP